MNSYIVDDRLDLEDQLREGLKKILADIILRR